MSDLSFNGLLHQAGHNLLAQGSVIVLGTFILEDAATILAAMRVKTGGLAAHVALIALYVGIVVGDLGVYGLGRAAARFPWARRWRPRAPASRNWLGTHVVRVVFISRFIPGARLPTYTACGFAGADLKRFALAAIGATLIWTSLLFGVSLRVGGFLIAHLGVWRWAGMACFMVAIVVISRFAARFYEDQQ